MTATRSSGASTTRSSTTTPRTRITILLRHSTSKYFHEYVVSTGIRGTMPVTVDVIPIYGQAKFSSLWRKVAPANSYPNWSAYREIDRGTMQGHLEEGARWATA
jgi:hypothetical protein